MPSGISWWSRRRPEMADRRTEDSGVEESTRSGVMSIGLHNLQPAPGARKDRKRVGRGNGSGHGKTAGRGHKGYGSRAGAKDRARFEGGQTPIHMRIAKLRGPKQKMSIPFEMFRTHTQPVNLGDLEARFESGASVDAAALAAAGLATRRGVRVKVLGRGGLSKP